MKAFLNQLKNKWNDDSGIGSIEILLILIVLIALVLLFKDELITLLGSIFGQLSNSATSVWQ